MINNINDYFKSTDIKEINKLIKKGNKIDNKIKQAKETVKSLHNEEKEVREDINKIHTGLISKAFLKISEAKKMNEITEAEYLELLKHPYFNVDSFFSFQPLETDINKNEKTSNTDENNEENFIEGNKEEEGERIITYENENENHQ